MARVESVESATRLEAGLNTTFRRTLAASLTPTLRTASATQVRLLPAARGIDSWTRGFRRPGGRFLNVVSIETPLAAGVVVAVPT